MAGIPVSTRIPRDAEQLVDQVMRDEHLDRSTALRKLLLLGAEEYRRRTALEALTEGRVSFGEAAEMAGVTLWEFWDLAKARKVHWVAGDVADDVKQALTR